jgi:hypothetical protein
MNSKQKGSIAEISFIAECVKRNWTISIPYGDNCRYDCIIDRGRGLERIQIKSSTYEEKKNRIVSFTRRIYNNQKGSICNIYTREEIDGFVIYSPELNTFYYIPIEEQEQASISLRINRDINAKNGCPNIRWADNYIL